MRAPVRVKIVGTGLEAPPRAQTAAELAPLIGRSEEWIRSRTGVIRRHVADDHEDVAELGARAARWALRDGPPPDLILNASGVPRQILPDGSVFVQRALGLAGVPCWSVHATCLSFLVALQTAAVHVASGSCRRVLIVSVELGTRGRNLAEPESAALLGDGAAAAVLEPTPDAEESALLAWRMATWSDGADLTEVRGGGTRCHPNGPGTRPVDNLFHMAGPDVFRLALRRAPEVLLGTLGDAGLSPCDVDLVIPHQPSTPGVEILPRLGFPRDRVVNIVAEYGNCVAASLPMALATAEADGRLRRGQRVLLCGSGAGLSVAAAVLRW